MTLKELERQVRKLRPKRIILSVQMPDGTERRMTATEFVGSGYDFLSEAKIVGGNDMDDIRLILSTFPSVIEQRKNRGHLGFWRVQA